jgi:hypothetical protein
LLIANCLLPIHKLTNLSIRMSKMRVFYRLATPRPWDVSSGAALKAQFPNNFSPPESPYGMKPDDIVQRKRQPIEIERALSTSCTTENLYVPTLCGFARRSSNTSMLSLTRL